MTEHIHKCPADGNYTLKNKCSCGQDTFIPRPPKFSLIDKYADLKREIKKKELNEKGLY